ncbi:MAG: hypothetical protein KF824_04500 [Fimbriimonadaceae bacterium]|nr:MAG: hypothetical protein KF824_04500 [Fimbriimonadaceae bacterium]
MLASALFAVFAQSQAQPELWVSGNLKVTVDPGTGRCTVQKRNSNDSITLLHDSIYPVVVKKQDGISLRGTSKGKQFFTEITRHSDTKVRVVTTFSDPSGISTDQFCDEYAVSSTFKDQAAAPGFEAYWHTPFVLARSATTRLTVIPNLKHFSQPGPFPAILSSNKIGYQNATMTQTGDWSATNTKVNFPSKGTASIAKVDYMIGLDPTSGSLSKDQSMVAEQIWRSEADARRYRAYPQKVPMVIGEYTTLGFKQIPKEVDGPLEPMSNDPETGLKRWWSEDTPAGKVGGPAGQKNALFGVEANGMRIAWAMKSWGKGTNQTRLDGPADMYVRLLLSSSPENGFATNAKSNEPATYDAPTANAKLEEIATAYYALRWISEFPQDVHTPELTKRVLAVINRIPASNNHPIALALYAASQAMEGLPSSIQSQLNKDQQNMLSEAVILPKYKNSHWTLEAYYWLAHKDAARFKPAIVEVVNSQFLRQNAFDRADSDHISSFGSFGAGTAEIARDSADYASVIGRLGILLNMPHWLDRSAFGLRSLHTLWSTLHGAGSPDAFPRLEAGYAFPGYGNDQPNRPDTRTNFESAEGRYVAATWEVLKHSGGLYTFADETHIGVDGLITDSAGNLRNSLFSNPLPFARAFHEPTRSATSTERQRSLGIEGIPAIASFTIERRSGEYFLVASPGLSIPPGSPNPAGVFGFGGSQNASQAAILGARGFETPLSSTDLASPVMMFQGSAVGRQISGLAVLPSGSPLRLVSAFPQGWFRSGDLRRLNNIASTTAPGNALWMTGTLTTPPMTCEGKAISFTARGEGECAIRILDPMTHEELIRWVPGPTAEAVNLELTGLDGKQVQVQIEDADTKGWIELSGLSVTGLK